MQHHNSNRVFMPMPLKQGELKYTYLNIKFYFSGVRQRKQLVLKGTENMIFLNKTFIEYSFDNTFCYFDTSVNMCNKRADMGLQTDRHSGYNNVLHRANPSVWFGFESSFCLGLFRFLQRYSQLLNSCRSPFLRNVLPSMGVDPWMDRGTFPPTF